MTPLRKTAFVAGVFYLLTFISIPTLFLYGQVKTDRDFITSAGSSAGVLWGALLEVIVALAGIGTAVTLFPVVKRQNEGMALGFVAVRTVEAAMIFIGVVSLLSLVHLRHDPGAAAGADTASLVTTGASLVSTYNGTFLLGQTLMPCMSAVLLGTLMYRVRPRTARHPADRTHRSPPAPYLHHRGAVRHHRANLSLVGDCDPPGGPVGVFAGSVVDLHGLPALPRHRGNDRSGHPIGRPRRRPCLTVGQHVSAHLVPAEATGRHHFHLLRWPNRALLTFRAAHTARLDHRRHSCPTTTRRLKSLPDRRTPSASKPGWNQDCPAGCG